MRENGAHMRETTTKWINFFFEEFNKNKNVCVCVICVQETKWNITEIQIIMNIDNIG